MTTNTNGKPVVVTRERLTPEREKEARAMLAMTFRQPYATAALTIKGVDNRKTAPFKQLLKQRFAVHAGGQFDAKDEWGLHDALESAWNRHFERMGARLLQQRRRWQPARRSETHLRQVAPIHPRAERQRQGDTLMRSTQTPPGFKRALFSMAMVFAAFVFALLSQGCADSHTDPREPVITMACVRSFATVLAEWKVFAREPVPEQCQFLDADYDVQLVSAAEMPPQCADGAVGCTLAGEKVIYLLEGRDEIATVDTSVHEWIHALSACAIGDPDVGHYRAGLWEDSRPTSVEVRAQAAAVLGECL